MQLVMPCVLVVDNDPAILKLCVHVLSHSGWGVTTAASSLEASRLPPISWDALLVDLHLQGESGLELARRLRARHAEMGVVLMTADQSALHHPAVDGFLLKPFDSIAQLSRALHDAIASRQSRLLLRNVKRKLHTLSEQLAPTPSAFGRRDLE